MTGHSADTPHSVLALVIAPLYISSTNFTIMLGPHYSLGIKMSLIRAQCRMRSPIPQRRSIGCSNIFCWICFTMHMACVVPFPFMNPNCIPCVSTISLNLLSTSLSLSVQDLHCMFHRLYSSIASALHNMSFCLYIGTISLFL